jgi:uncharacterized protein YprB with RNaseH-like and TPR domain
MTDIKDKLEQLKRERKARSKTQSIQETWAQIGKEGGLTTREKLEQLIKLRPDLTIHKPPSTSAAPPSEAPDRVPLQFTENPYALDARYGSVTIGTGLDISGHILACLSREPEFEELDLSTALFFDLETTGLSGGTGTIPFNIGLGYYREDKFWVSQYFLGELASESRMIEELSEFLADMDFKSIVTFNGKTYDVPLLETRFILQRKPFRLNGLPHLDFLFPARSLWQHKVENCRLSYLAREVLNTGRDEDIPSAEVPWRYFQYLQTGNFELIEPVLYHNAEDILSLLGLVILGASIFEEDPESCSADHMDFFGAGKVLERAGQTEKAADFFQRALNGSLTEEVGLSTRRRLASQYKRAAHWDKAVSLWTEMAGSQAASSDLLYSLRELSMYFEHRAKEYQQAHKYAEEGYVVSMGFSEYYLKDFSHRKDRLKQKIKKTESSSEDSPPESKPKDG